MELSELDWNLFFTTTSGCSTAVAAYFSYNAIKENEKNVFLLQRNEVASELRKLYLKFQFEYETFHISMNLEYD